MFESGNTKQNYAKHVGTEVHNSQEAVDTSNTFDEFNLRQQTGGTKDGREATRSSIKTEQDSLVNKKNSQLSMSFNTNQTSTNNGSGGAGNGSKMHQHSSGKNSSLNGKISTSIKATWTVNRTSYG